MLISILLDEHSAWIFHRVNNQANLRVQADLPQLSGVIIMLFLAGNG